MSHATTHLQECLCGKRVAKCNVGHLRSRIPQSDCRNSVVEPEFQNDDCRGKIARKKILVHNLAIRLNLEILLSVGATRS